jgi:hypothetical protein
MSDKEHMPAVQQAAPPPMTVDEIKGQVVLIDSVMKGIMQEGQHYGKIPGCGPKPTLLKPGAEKLCLTFRLAPQITSETIIDMPNGHREYRLRLGLNKIGSGEMWAEGVGSCSTMEGKFRFRTGEKTVTDKPVPQEYWTLRKDDPAKAEALIGKGNGTKKVDGKWFITTGGGSKVEHDNPADYYNTCYKMAYKRALVSTSIAATGASDIFTQDIEDMPEVIPGVVDKKDSVVGTSDRVQGEIVEAEFEDSGLPSPTVKGDSSPAQIKMINSLLSGMDIKDALARHEYVSNLCEYTDTIASLSYLSKAKASEVIKKLKDMEAF